ncbi:MAG: flagellar basal body P-ring formation chaperone FlgA [Tepidisphaerales bacterium]
MTTGDAAAVPGSRAVVGRLAGGLVLMIGFWAAAEAARGQGVSRPSGPAAGVVSHPVVIELREEASVIGGEVRLRQVARWNRADNAFFAAGLADLVVLRLQPEARSATLDLATLRVLLEGAGVLPTEVVFRGASRVRITRLDTDPTSAVRPLSVPQLEVTAFLDRHGVPPVEDEPASPADGAASAGGVASASGAASAGGAARADGVSLDGGVSLDDGAELASARLSPEGTPVAAGRGGRAGMPAAVVATGRTLRQTLTQDLADRLGVRVEDLEVTFDPADERVLRLAEPTFRWKVTSGRVRNLGVVSWTVTVWASAEDDGAAGSQVRGSSPAMSARRGGVGDGGQRVELTGRARMWQQQVVARRALVPGQLVREDDIEERRVLVERLPDEAVLSREQVLMMQAARAIAPGTVLAGRMLDPVLLVRAGQLVSVSLRHGTVEVRAVARALEGGAYGQTIRVRNEQTNDVLQVTVTGPQEARLGPGSVRE